MSLSNHTQSVSDMQLEEMLLSLREPESTEAAPPVVNTFRLEMEAERRRSRIQLEIVTIAAFVSVVSSVVFTAVFFRFMLPDLIAHGDSRMNELFISFRADLNAVWEQFGGLFIAIALTLLIGYVFSAVLLFAKRDVLFTKNEQAIVKVK